MKNKKQLVDLITIFNNTSIFRHYDYYYDIIENAVIIVNPFLYDIVLNRFKRAWRGFDWILHSNGKLYVTEFKENLIIF